MSTVDNITQRYRDVYSNYKNDNQFNLRTDLPIIDNEQYEFFTTKKHKIKDYKNNHVLDMRLGEIDTRPDFSIARPLTLADRIGKAVVREQNQDNYEKMLLENQSRDIEQYMAQNYMHHVEKDLTDNIKNHGSNLEVTLKNNIMDNVESSKNYNEISVLKNDLPREHVIEIGNAEKVKNKNYAKIKKVNENRGRKKGDLNKSTVMRILDTRHLPSVPENDILDFSPKKTANKD